MRNLLTEVSKMKNMMGLQEADKPKYNPEVKSLVSVLKDNKVYSAQIQKFINKIDDYSKDGLVDFGLITRGVLKTLKLKGNKDINVFEFFKQLTKSLEKRKNKKEVVNPEEEPSILDKDIYKKEIFFLQVELLKLQEWLKQTGKTVIIVFEGRDSSGKGSTIKKFTENLNPRYYKVIALGIPTPDERKNWWDRYSNQIEKGKINFFDRSWYNRGLVEPVMGYGSSEEYEDFMDNVQDFEESLVVDGDYLFKLWFSIDKETQAKRFDFRQKSPLKYWKYSENDEKMQDVWEKFTEYKQKLFDKTSTVNHPWVILDSNDKKISGLNSIRYVLQNIPYTNKDEDVLNKDFPEAMTVLKPNINEQSVFDFYNQLTGKSQQKQGPNFMDTWSSMAPPKGNKPPKQTGDNFTPKIQNILNLLKGYGYSKEISSAIVANMVYESGINPIKLNQDDKGAPAFGLIQWRGNDVVYKNGVLKPVESKKHSRLKKLLQMPGYNTNQKQVEFLHNELKSEEKGKFEIVKRAVGPYNMAKLFDEFVERSSGETREKRGQLAQKIYDDINNGYLKFT